MSKIDTVLTDELALIESVLKGYEPSMARNDALRACKAILSKLSAKTEAQPVAWLYTLWFDDEAVQQIVSLDDFNTELQPFGRIGIDYSDGGTVVKEPLYTAPLHQQESRPKVWMCVETETPCSTCTTRCEAAHQQQESQLLEAAEKALRAARKRVVDARPALTLSRKSTVVAYLSDLNGIDVALAAIAASKGGAP